MRTGDDRTVSRAANISENTTRAADCSATLVVDRQVVLNHVLKRRRLNAILRERELGRSALSKLIAGVGHVGRREFITYIGVQISAQAITVDPIVPNPVTTTNRRSGTVTQ